MSKPKLSRKVISLETKIKILDLLQDGQRTVDIAKKFNLDEGTIRTIKRNEQKIRGSVISGSAISAKHTNRTRNAHIEKMEKALVIWIENNNQKGLPIDSSTIREKAKRIFNHLINQGIQTEINQGTEFLASKGWLEKFKRRYSLHNIKLKGESNSGDKKAAEEYPSKLAKIIEKGSYSPEQIFNADETGLLWKKMPSRTFMSKTEKIASGFKAAKDRITLLLCSNASGDCLMKPLLINRAINPRALKGLNKNNLPVHWRANKKSWMTAALFQEWFFQHFVPEVEVYTKKNNLEFKILLLIDNAPAHSCNLEHPSIRVEFLPPNTTSLIQPLDQGIIYTFKANYIKRAFKKIFDDMEDDNSQTISQVWKKFNIRDCLNIIASTITDIKKSTLNACWKAICPSIVLSNNDIESRESINMEIINIARSIRGEGLEDLTINEIDELFEEHELNEEELIEMTTNVPPEIRSDARSDNESSCSISTITARTIKDGLDIAKNLEMHFLKNDPDMDRALKFQQEIKQCIAKYEEIYKNIRKDEQSRITDFFKRRQNITENLIDQSSSDDDVQPIKRKKCDSDSDIE